VQLVSANRCETRTRSTACSTRNIKLASGSDTAGDVANAIPREFAFGAASGLSTEMRLLFQIANPDKSHGVVRGALQ